MLSSVCSYGGGKAELWQPCQTALCCASTSLLIWVAHSDSLELESDFSNLYHYKTEFEILTAVFSIGVTVPFHLLGQDKGRLF